ncbi:MAG: alpha/beta-type small acid-soluble spore protein [Firmicutes bacterium]|nr:alpha/beta-type small acid-soluble spore protein [Bacillota bacterium]
MPKYLKRVEKMTARELELEKIKLEIAEELGFGERVRANGWGDMTARETGRVGGIMSRRLRNMESSIASKK